MFENTTYKAFVAETAAKIAAEISAKFVTAQDTSLLAKDEATQHDMVHQCGRQVGREARRLVASKGRPQDRDVRPSRLADIEDGVRAERNR